VTGADHHHQLDSIDSIHNGQQQTPWHLLLTFVKPGRVKPKNSLGLAREIFGF
jgi:hypothetical protein